MAHSQDQGNLPVPSKHIVGYAGRPPAALSGPWRPDELVYDDDCIAQHRLLRIVLRRGIAFHICTLSAELSDHAVEPPLLTRLQPDTPHPTNGRRLRPMATSMPCGRDVFQLFYRNSRSIWSAASTSELCRPVLPVVYAAHRHCARRMLQ